MELYTLDGLLRRTEMVEEYESFIWTERYSAIGDIQIITPSSQQNRNLLANGTFLGLSESRRVMRLDTIEDTTDAEGDKQLTVSGIEITDVLTQRISATGTAGEQPGTWRTSGKPSDIIRTLFDYGCRNGLPSITDKIPLLVAGSLYPAGNIPEEVTTFILERDIGPLYDAIKEIADVWDLGFRLYRGPDDGKLYFDVYKGNDRTSGQSTKAPVIFSPDLDSLQNVSELTSTANFKNVATVINEFMTVTVYGEGASVDTAGFAKRVLFVSASDITYPERDNVISEPTQAALNKAIGLVDTYEVYKAQLQMILNRDRMTSAERTQLNASVAATTGLTAPEKTLITDAATASYNLNAPEDLVMTTLMEQRGLEELAKNRSISAFDGEITPVSPYKYREHYDLGDLVEMRNSDGLTNQMSVTEQIFAADGSGERAFPTLTKKLFITPGSWLAWESNQVWQDAPGTWSTS